MGHRTELKEGNQWTLSTLAGRIQSGEWGVRGDSFCWDAILCQGLCSFFHVFVEFCNKCESGFIWGLNSKKLRKFQELAKWHSWDWNLDVSNWEAGRLCISLDPCGQLPKLHNLATLVCYSERTWLNTQVIEKLNFSKYVCVSVCMCTHFTPRFLTQMHCTTRIWLPHMRILSKNNLAWNDVIHYFKFKKKVRGWLRKGSSPGSLSNASQCPFLFTWGCAHPVTNRMPGTQKELSTCKLSLSFSFSSLALQLSIHFLQTH